MRQQWHNRVLYALAKRSPLCRPASKRLFKMTHEYFVQVMVCTDDRHVSNVRRKQNFVDRGLELDLSSEEFGDFGASAVAAMCQLYVGWNNASAGQLPAQADQDSRE